MLTSCHFPQKLAKMTHFNSHWLQLRTMTRTQTFSYVLFRPLIKNGSGYDFDWIITSKIYPLIKNIKNSPSMARTQSTSIDRRPWGRYSIDKYFGYVIAIRTMHGLPGWFQWYPPRWIETKCSLYSRNLVLCLRCSTKYIMLRRNSVG